jgi:predicted Zn-dependent protease
MRKHLILSFILASGTAPAQLAPDAEKYHQMLLKRPQVGILYDRFYAAWLETGTTDELAAFLKDKTAAAEASAADSLLLAFFHEQQGDETAALAAFKTALEKDPSNASGWVQRGKLEARVLDFAAALESLTVAEKNQPSGDLTREIGTLRGRWLLRTGKPEPALQVWRDLLLAHADDDDLAEEVIELQMSEGLYSEAETQMTALIARTSDAYDKTLRQLRLAEILMRASKQEEALKIMAATLDATGQSSWIEGEVLARIEAVFRRDENLTGLLTHLEELAKVHPQRITLQKTQARVLAELGEKDKALALFANLLERTPGERELRESYLELLERFEQFKQGIEQTKVLLAQSPDDRELLIRLATLHERAKEAPAAKATLDQYLAAAATTEFDHLRVARFYESWDRMEEAGTAYEAMVTAFPESAAAKEAHAHFLHRTGKRDAALAIWRELAEVGDVTQLIAVGQALMSRNEAEPALEILQARATEFAQNERFLGLLVSAALSAKKDDEAQTWVVSRVRATSDINLLDEALRQCVTATDKEDRRQTVINELQKQPSLSVQERLLLATLLEVHADLVGAEKTLREMPEEHALAAQGRLARLMEARQDWLRAYEETQKLVAMPSGRTSGNVQRLAELAERNGHSDEALKWIADWKILSPGSVQPWLSEARLLRLNGQLRESLQLLRSASRKFEDDEAVADTLATAYAELGQLADAERIYLSKFEDAESPQDKMRWVASLARMARDRGQIVALTEKFQERQRTNRNDASPWLALAEIHRITDNTSEQERALREAMRLRPDDLNLAQQLARADLDLGQWKRALETLERIVNKDTTNRIKQLMASIQIEWGDENAGYRQLYEIAGGDKMDADDAVTLAKSMTAKQDWERAAAFLEPLVKQHPLDYRLGYLQAVSLEEAGRTDEALRLFTRLATQDVERPDAKPDKSQGANAMVAYFARLEKSMPREAWEFSRDLASNNSHLSYYYRQQQRFRSSRQGQSSAVAVPASLPASRSYAAAHLTTLIQDSSPDQAKAAWAAARAAGMPHTEILSAAKTDPYGQLQFEEPVESAEPASDALLALRLTRAVYQTGAVSDSAAEAFDRFKDSYPMLALQAAIIICKADIEKGAPALEQALDKLSQLPDELSLGSSISYPLVFILGGGPNMGHSDEGALDLPPVLRDKCLAFIMKLLDHKDPFNTTGASSSAAPMHLNACLHQEAWDAFLTLLEREMRLFETEPATAKAWSAQAKANASRSGGTPPVLAPLTFPHHAELPPTLTRYFRHNNPYNPQPNEQIEAEIDGYRPMFERLDKVSHPVLRAVLAFKAGDEKRAEQEITQLLEATNPSLDDLLLAASWYGMKENHMKAAELLFTAANREVPATSRAAFDAAFAHAVINAKDAAKPEWLPPAQMALRRLRTGRITAEQKDELLVAMKAVNLTEEAEQWAKIAFIAPSTQTSSSRSYSSSSNPDPTKLKQLLGGKDEAAIIKETIVQLKRCLSYAAQGNQSYAASRAKEILRLVSKPAYQEKIEAAFAVSEDAATSKLMEYAGFLDLIAKKEQAKAVLEKLVARDPNQHEARLHLCTLIAAKEPERAVQLLQAIPVATFQRTNLGEQILTLLSSSNIPFEARMNLAGSFADMLAEATGANGSVPGLEWLVDLPALIANRSYQNPRLPNLAWRPGHDDGNDEAFLADDSPPAQQRLQMMNRICQAFMKHPQYATEGFRWHALLSLKAGQAAEELTVLATTLLEAAKPFRTRPPLPSRYGYQEEVHGLWKPSPAEFLVWQAWKQDQTERIEKEILPLAASALDNTSLALLRGQHQILTCTPEDFPAIAKTFVNTASRQGGNYGADPQIVWLIDRWEERKLPGTPLDQLVLDSLKSTGRGYNTPYGVIHYLTVRSRLRPELDSKDFLRQTAQTLLGPDPAKWPGMLKSSLDSYYGRGGSSYTPTGYAFIRFVQTLVRKPDSLLAGIHIATLTGMSSHSGWSDDNFSDVTRMAKTQTGALPVLRALGWLEQAEAFQLAPDAGALSHKVLSTIATSPDLKQALRPQLAAIQPQTFGTEFISAYLSDNPGPSLTAFLKRSAEAVAKVPEASRVGLAALIKAKVPALRTPATADKVLVDALQPLLAEELKKAADLVERWLAATTSTEISANDQDYDTKIVDTLKDLVPNDPELATKLFVKASDLMEARTKSKGWQGYTGGNGWTNRSNYLDSICKGNKLEFAGWAMKMWHEDTSGNLSSDGWSHSKGYGQALMEIWRNSGGGAVMGRGIDPLLKRVDEVMQDTPHTLLPLVFYDFIQRLPKSHRQPAMRYAAKVPPTHPQAVLARELEFAARHFLTTDPESRTAEGFQNAVAELGGMEPVWAHYRSKLADTQLNAQVRQALGHFLIYQSRERTDPECIKLAAAAALESQKAKHCLHGYQYAWILFGFNHLPIDDAWKQAAQEHWDAWVARNLDGGLGKYSPHDWVINSVLRMTARSGNEEWARSILRQFHATLSNEQSGIASLVMGGMTKLAAEHFEAEWRGFFVNAQKEISWCQELQDALPAFSQACADPGIALLGELYLSSLKDPPKADHDAIKDFKPKTARLKDLAARFKEITFKDPEVRKACVEILCDDWESAALIADVAQEVSAATDFEALATHQNTWEFWKQLKPMQFALGIKAAAGDVQPAIEAYDKALAANFSSSYYHRYLVKETGWGPLTVTPWQWAQEFKADQPSKTKALLPFLDHVLTKTPAELRDSHFADAISVKWLIHLIHNEEADFKSWHQSLKPADAKAYFDKLSTRWQIWSLLNQYCNPAGKTRLTADERLPLVNAILKHEWTLQRYPAVGNPPLNLVNDLMQKIKLFKPDEFALVAPAIAETLPRNGRTAEEAADFLVAIGKPEPAATLYALAARQAAEANPKDYMFSAKHLVKQAETLERTGKKPEALKIYTSLDPARLGAVPKRNTEAALKRLGHQP